MKKVIAIVLSVMFAFVFSAATFAAEKKEAAPAEKKEAAPAEKKAEKMEKKMKKGKKMEMEEKAN